MLFDKALDLEKEYIGEIIIRVKRNFEIFTIVKERESEART